MSEAKVLTDQQREAFDTANERADATQLIGYAKAMFFAGIEYGRKGPDATLAESLALLRTISKQGGYVAHEQLGRINALLARIDAFEARIAAQGGK